MILVIAGSPVHTLGTMSEDQFTKLFVYMERRFNELEAKIDTKADKTVVDQILVTLVDTLKRLEDNDQERLIILHRLDRHEEWFDQVSGRLKLNFVPGR